MSYLIVSAGIAGILKKLGYQESEQAVNFDNASSEEYGNTFILKSMSGATTEESETQADRFYDSQTWQILFAFPKSAQNDKINMDEIQEAKDEILADVDDPANWVSFVRHMKYKSWELEERPNYYLLTVTLTVTDVYTY